MVGWLMLVVGWIVDLLSGWLVGWLVGLLVDVGELVDMG